MPSNQGLQSGGGGFAYGAMKPADIEQLARNRINRLKELRKIGPSKFTREVRNEISEILNDLDEMQEHRNREPGPAFSGSSGDQGVRFESKENAAGPFKSLAEQLTAVRKAESPGEQADSRLFQIRASGMSEGVLSDGGFLLQPDFSREILKKAYEAAPLPNLAKKYQLSSNSIKIPGVDETSRADGSRWGGVRAYWLSEAAEKTASKPQFRQIELNLHKSVVLVYATDELLEDSGALANYLNSAAVDEIGFAVQTGMITGSGAGQPLGIKNSSALVTVAKEAGQAAGTLVWENVIKLWSRMWGRSRPNAVWLINQDLEPQLYSMSLTVGTGGAAVYMPAGGASGQPYSTLFGRPVIPIEQCETLGTKGDIYLADFSQYLLADKGGVDAQQSIHVRFIYDETTFRFVHRVDGLPSWNSPLTPFKGTNTQSPFVTLAARS